ncbi:MAG: V-type ATP synthase subunit F [Promethearchaeota archaeon]
MKIISVGDEDMNILFGLIGIHGKTLPMLDPPEFQAEFDQIIKDKEIGLILMNEKYLIKYKSYFKSIKSRKFPIVVEVPDIKGPLDFDFFKKFIQNYIGL